MQLLKAPNDFLEKPVKPFDFDTMDAKQISGEMCQIMMAQQGIGLSANQVGIDAQIFVMRPLNNKDVTKPFAVINPIIREVSNETELAPEGCLSYPNLVLRVTRPKELVAQFLDIDNKECILTLNDIDARCFLHEYDHLQGITFDQRVSKLKLQMAMKKARKIEKRTING
jgi:peptide deformylase